MIIDCLMIDVVRTRHGRVEFERGAGEGEIVCTIWLPTGIGSARGYKGTALTFVGAFSDALDKVESEES